MPRPLQILAMTLPTGDPVGRLLAVIDDFDASASVRALDVLIVSKQPDGSLVRATLGEDDDFGDLVARLFPVEGGGPVLADAPEADLWARAESVPPGTAVAFLLVEHRWATDVIELLEDEGGAMLSAGFLSPGLEDVIDAEVSAMEDAAQSVVAAQAVETDAWLRTAAAAADADAAVEDAALIRSAATAQTLRVLTEAGLVQQAAADEAVDALSAAGMVIAAADDAADRVVREDAAIAAGADAATAASLLENARLVASADAAAAGARTAASVTPAELRVLRVLPTTMNFAMIADKLGISRAAAKSRATRMYKKLGVHSRADAVSRAKALHAMP